MMFRQRLAVLGPLTLLATLVLAAAGRSASPDAKLCVKPSGGSCYTTIQAAVNAANPGDTIQVFNGTYPEDVVIGKALTLIGQSSRKTVIDAKKLSNGIFIDGLDNPGLSDVKISRFKVMHANFEGVLAVNASHVEISNNVVERNDLALNIGSVSCPGLPTWETDEHFDCGEGIHLSGVAHSTVSGNLSRLNSGGILISDDTARVEYNLIINNVAHNNPYDCGIVLASHPPAPGSTAPHYGVVGNLVVGNTSSLNGVKRPGEGAGVGMFSDGTGPGLLTGNTVTNNLLIDNGLPGAILQSHAAFDDLRGNSIVSNTISGNGALEMATTGIDVYSALGPSHLGDTVITGNVVSNEQVDISFDVPLVIGVHSNSFLGTASTIGLQNAGTGKIDATYNWWGCSTGPGSSSSCTRLSGMRIRVRPWLRKPPSL